MGESIEEAAVREAEEESGYDVELLRKIDIFQDMATEAVKHAFEAKIIGGKLHYPEYEILDARWWSYEDLVGMKDILRGD